ncbi:TlpA family protein disulfide reductase [Chryseobacterium jejuense]|uniref:Thiol-disulfide isomerase or thioredoxin n=1 Tax=Chryseobacterium jejuense TaxID=445960 RepID=A0A2X2X6H3_CHRJE|nr:TlpA disulfide reductase family protein [Chryseobacterium jejuense]SDJ53374.1 Thiol-disulfide isomerase or thioredoxin [Chryseobacterium jejuense]SQB46291.1 thiol-disulfide oxidoreductase [Chryseobacterium jejuense]
MKKYLLLFIIAIFVMSCSKKVEVKGKITGSSPLERIEFVEASGVGTLPLINIGLDKEGNFSGSFEAPKDGMYVINYANKQNLIYLEGGQKVNISGNAMTFPNEYVITGDAKKNNDFLTATQKFLGEYGNKIDLRQLMAGDEASFVKGMQKVEADINKNVDDLAAKNNPSKALLEWKKNDVKVTILNLLANYEMSHGAMAGNPAYKASKALTDYQTKLDNDKEAMVKTIPLYRQYLLVKMTPDFQKYAEANSKNKTGITTSEMFAKYLSTKKDISQTAKDYLLAFVMAQADIHPTTTTANIDKIKKLIDTDIKDATIKSDLLKMQMAITGLKIGDVAPEAALVKQDGKAYKLSENKGKPYVLFFYASWNPYIAEATVPVLKEVVNFYKSKMNFVFVNVDDTKDQFIKTSNSLLKGIQGVNVYGEKGMESDIAKKYGVYGFKLPCFVIIDKDGKIASRSFVNLGEQELVTILDKLTGLAAPKVDPGAQMQPQLQMDPAAQQQVNPQPAPTK